MIWFVCYTPQTWGCLSANEDSEWINKRRISSLKRCQLLGQFQQRWELHGTTTKLHASGANVQDWDIWDNLQCAYVCIVCSVHWELWKLWKIASKKSDVPFSISSRRRQPVLLSRETRQISTVTCKQSWVPSPINALACFMCLKGQQFCP